MKRFILRHSICLILVFSVGISIKAQNVVDKLPYTYRNPFPNGYIETTIHKDGSMTSMTCTGCVLCGGCGFCQVCAGTGGQFYYGIGMMTCGRCFGDGRCKGCGGKGYSIMNSQTSYGVTVGFDEQGNMYVAGGGSTGSGGSYSSTRKRVEVIEYIPTYGVEANKHVYCPKCKSTGSRHIHVLK